MTISPVKAPDPIDALANRCVVHVEKRLGFKLDFEYETLGVVDHFVRLIAAEEGAANESPGLGGAEGHILHLLAPTVGAYFGEILRRKFSCRWRFLSQKAPRWMLEFDEVVLRFNPVGAAAEAFALADIEAFGGALSTSLADSPSLAERLAASPPVLQTDFYLLTTRFEVVQIAEEWLRSQYTLTDSPPPAYISPQDYDRIFH